MVGAELDRQVLKRQGSLDVAALVYFDTDCFHHFASTFQDHPLSDDLRDKLLFSPITMLEVFSHLARFWGDRVHKQLQGMHNWVVTDHALVLPWMDAAVSHIGFDMPLEDDYAKTLQADLNACVSSELSGLLVVAKARDDELQQIKHTYAQHFQTTVDFFRKNPLTEDTFTEMWFTGLANRVGVGTDTKTSKQVAAVFSALHELEYNKLKVAVANKSYNAAKHKNDLFDAEQLVYLGDPALHFLTIDGGYLSRVLKSAQRQQIHEVSSTLLADAGRTEDLLKQITT